jgi:mannosyltransferase OCH1-like enzyme
MFKSDILRYEVLHKLGGVYVDFDFLCLKNIEPLLQKDYLRISDLNIGFSNQSKAS